jgi:hypothetical protein
VLRLFTGFLLLPALLATFGLGLLPLSVFSAARLRPVCAISISVTDYSASGNRVFFGFKVIIPL